MELHRTGRSTIRIHAFQMTNEVDSEGFFTGAKHVIVSFVLEEITDLRLDDFSDQNVIFGLDLTQTTEGYELVLEGCYGLQGKITANRVLIEFEPGVPANSQYGRRASTRGRARPLTDPQ